MRLHRMARLENEWIDFGIARTMIGNKICSKFCAVAVLSALCLVQGCSESMLTDGEYLDRGKEYFYDGDYKASVLELKNALQQNHKNGEARWLLAHNYIILGDGVSAEKELKIASELGITSPELTLNTAKAMYMQRDFQRLIDTFEKNSDIGSVAANSTLQTYIARAYLGLVKFEEAEQAFNEAYKIQPSNPEALIGLARLASTKKNIEEAEKRVAEVIQLAPEDAGIWLAKGDIESELRNHADAEQSYQKVIDLEGGKVLTYASSRAQMGIIRTKLALKKTSEAKEHLDVLAKVSPKHLFVIYFRGVIAHNEGDFAAALIDFQDIEKRYPDFRQNILMLGATHLALNSYQQAEIYLQRFLKLQPEFVPARIALASLQLKVHHPEQALELLGETSALEDNTDILSLMADASVQMGELGQGSAFINKAVKQAPDEQRLKIKLASSELLLGNPEKAISVIQSSFTEEDKPFAASLVEIDAYLKVPDNAGALAATNALINRFPDDPRGYNLRGSIKLVGNELEAAVQDFELAIEKDPEFAGAWVNLGVAAEKQSDVASAKKHYEKAVGIDETTIQATLSLARIAEGEGRKDDRITWLERARKSSPRAIEPRVLLARYYILANRNSEVLRLSNELVGISENHPETLKLRGAILAGQGSFEQSNLLYVKLVDVAPSAENLLRLAKSEMRLERYGAARKNMAKVLKINPNSITAQSMMVSLEIRDKEYAAALDRAKKLQLNAPDSMTGYLMQGDVHNAQHRYAEAVKAYEAAAKASPTGGIVGKKAWAMHMNGDDRGAEKTLVEWLERNPDDVTRSLMVASIKEMQGDAEGAARYYKNVLIQEQRNFVAQNQMAVILDKSGKLDEALVFAENAYKNSNNQVAPTDTFGWLLVKSGSINRGLQLLQKASELAPNELNIQYHYAYALNEVGDERAAKRVLEGIFDKPGVEFEERESARALLASLK
ncbi:XrtA/PEP-CTERM system TPR-repeat protein PrsT [Pseudomonadota bacterium]